MMKILTFIGITTTIVLGIVFVPYGLGQFCIYTGILDFGSWAVYPFWVWFFIFASLFLVYVYYLVMDYLYHLNWVSKDLDSFMNTFVSYFVFSIEDFDIDELYLDV